MSEYQNGGTMITCLKTIKGNAEQSEDENFNFVINLQDGIGKEYYLSWSGELIGLTDKRTPEPQTLETDAEINCLINQLREKYSTICRIYAIDSGEFEERRRKLIGSVNFSIVVE